MLNVEMWAEKNFSEVDLGDRRRTRRIVGVAKALASQAEAPQARAFKHWRERKAFYRLVATPEVTCERVTASHRDRTRAQCRRAAEVVAVADLTQLDFTAHPATQGLGQVGNELGRGLQVHTTLALEITGWDESSMEPQARVLGLLDQEAWVRKAPPRQGREGWRQRLERPRESEAWGRRLGEIAGPDAPTGWTYVADREADIYEMFAGRVPEGMELIIRAARARTLADGEEGNLFTAAAKGKLLGRIDVPLRARPGQAARRARVSLRAASVRLRPAWRPKKKLPEVEVWIVEAREENPPQGVKALKWVLITNRAVKSFKQARRVVALYGMRWFVEEYHKALKSGTRMEDSQLSTADRLMALLGILAIVAVRLLDAKLLARAHPAEPVNMELCPPPLRRVLEQAIGPPTEGWTNRFFIRALAQLGGFLARKGDGEPGWQTIWRGWMIAEERLHGYLLAVADLKCG